MIDAISELFFTGIIDQKGKFARDLKTDRIRIEDEGPEFILYRGELRDIVLTQADVENVIRAKAAIYAGVSVLLKEVGLSLDIVERVYIAGGFGNYLDIDKAIMIGMLPDLPKEKFSFIGNTSIAGAYLCLLSQKDASGGRGYSQEDDLCGTLCFATGSWTNICPHFFSPIPIWTFSLL